MFFLISFVSLVAASFAFVLAILTPNWSTFIATSQNVTVQRGIFFLCDYLGESNKIEATACASILQQNSSFAPNKWKYGNWNCALSQASLQLRDDTHPLTDDRDTAERIPFPQESNSSNSNAFIHVQDINQFPSRACHCMRISGYRLRCTQHHHSVVIGSLLSRTSTNETKPSIAHPDDLATSGYL